MDARAEARYVDETRRLAVRRGPVAVTSFALALLLADALEWHYAPGRLGAILTASAVELVVCAVAFGLYRSARHLRIAVQVSQVTAVVLLFCVTLYFRATAGTSAGLALVVVSVELVAALMFPWGLRGQLPVAVAGLVLYGSYVATAPAATASVLPPTYGFLAVAFGAGLSTIGAAFLDRYRRALFEQRDRLDRHVATFQNLTQTFHGFDPQRVLLVACISVLQDFAMRRLWAVWQTPERGAVQAYVARCDGGGVTMAAVADPGPLWSELSAWVQESEAFVVAADDPRLPGGIRAAAGGAVLCIPLRFEGETLGGFFADRDGVPFDLEPQLLGVAAVIARGVAIAMANARLYHQATAASEEKSTFLARIAHELRNPLHTMLWDVDTLEREGAGQPAVFERLRQNALMTLSAAAELQEFSEVETQRAAIAPEPVSIPQVFDELRATAVALLGDRPVGFASEIGRGAETLVTDPYRLRQVLGNFLANAVQFTRRGGIHLGAERRGNEVAISVRDTGSGIDRAELAAIFAPFYRGSARSASPRRGMGLGLAIAQDVAGLLGGRIEVESTVGSGSTFRLILPRTAGTIGGIRRADGDPEQGDRRQSAA
jgi:signal transduction histidine kinase